MTFTRYSEKSKNANSGRTTNIINKARLLGENIVINCPEKPRSKLYRLVVLSLDWKFRTEFGIGVDN